MKKGTLIFLCIVLALVLVIGGGVLYLHTGFANDEAARNRGEYVETEVTIDNYATAREIGAKLKEAGIIRFNQHFYEYVKQKGVGGRLQSGTFPLNSAMTYDEILEVITTPQGRRADLWVTVPEGSTAIRTAQIVAEQTGLCTAEEFLEVANNGDFSQYWWWNEIPAAENRFMKAEGYLMPDTYNFYNDSTVYELVDRFYAAFDAYASEDDLRDRLQELDMTLDDAVILGSMIQEEAGNEQDAMVSSVFHNRLANGWRLESNASSYIRNDDDNNYVHNWIAPYYGGWENIPAGMAEAYDTYAVEGLPVGPISCPGREALTAALYPAQSDYFFFVTDPQGNYYYAATADEHYANCAKAGLPGYGG